jgi:hypothetical protein
VIREPRPSLAFFTIKTGGVHNASMQKMKIARASALWTNPAVARLTCTALGVTCEACCMYEDSSHSQQNPDALLGVNPAIDGGALC